VALAVALYLAVFFLLLHLIDRLAAHGPADAEDGVRG
jgi:hypothetical protein